MAKLQTNEFSIESLEVIFCYFTNGKELRSIQLLILGLS